MTETTTQLTTGVIITNATFEVAMFPVGDIVLQTKDRRNFAYDPKDDVTNIELARLMHLFAYANSSRFGLTWEPFVEQHGLWRHFKEKA